MKKLSKRMSFFLFVCLIPFSALSLAQESADVAPVQVQISTNIGNILLELHKNAAPTSVTNFLTYASNGFYSNTVFHRVIPGFMIQGGGFDSKYAKKDTQAPIKNEANNGLKNQRGTIAMARTSDPHSATSQFFINLADNTFLNHTAPNTQSWGYTVFGKVVEGMGVVDQIATIKTGRQRAKNGQSLQNVPTELVLIEKVSLLPQK